MVLITDFQPDGQNSDIVKACQAGDDHTLVNYHPFRCLLVVHVQHNTTTHWRLICVIRSRFKSNRTVDFSQNIDRALENQNRHISNLGLQILTIYQHFG